ncbi:hypothetical protein VOLCADRAFT_100795 [Volvox carteri f. nagariensis]|uniref:Uncharacterized protein n=1 Tax=Volvox carteri f. nagariensis TaxID=3068 RepID=D8UL17_VOLCA|nr:uncharacterized protein VOLCADRAFT_100795 [Volvox carteri f. nagariensis]EFJ39583.1 hypothetical protein VOLCADRAFT_100795 [Volvox carteri f. nagariensis]|eukprot:XP_002959355.1 hypothetical protein VOLCADRAFT_100795 [Volvox carteri f. nagariensis]
MRGLHKCGPTAIWLTVSKGSRGGEFWKKLPDAKVYVACFAVFVFSDNKAQAFVNASQDYPNTSQANLAKKSAFRPPRHKPGVLAKVQYCTVFTHPAAAKNEIDAFD